MRAADPPATDALRFRPEGRQDSCERGDRILDATLDLVLQLGYPKVNVQDIADRAGVGKGTVYLHWSSKEDILGCILHREHQRLCRGHAARLAKDPGLVVISGTARVLFQGVMASPLLRAYNTGDAKVLGHHTAEGRRDALRISLASMLTAPRYLHLLELHGLVPEDVTTDGGRTAIEAVVNGFVGTADQHELPGGDSLRPRLLSAVMHRAFEPAETPAHDSILEAARAVLQGGIWSGAAVPETMYAGARR